MNNYKPSDVVLYKLVDTWYSGTVRTMDGGQVLIQPTDDRLDGQPVSVDPANVFIIPKGLLGSPALDDLISAHKQYVRQPHPRDLTLELFNAKRGAKAHPPT